MRRGEIWYAVWPSDPHRKERPVLIVSNDLRNASQKMLDVIVVKLTALYRDEGSRKKINEAEDVVVAFKKETIIRCGAIFTIEKRQLLKSVRQLSGETMKEVDEKLKDALELR